MNYKELFDEVKNFLAKHKYIFELEVLKRYPSDIDPYYLDLSRNLSGRTNEELAAFESEFLANKNYSDELNSLLECIHKLIDVEQLGLDETVLDKDLKRKLNPKKLHELSTLKTFFDDSEFEEIFDIGGGVGHLSNVFVYGQGKSALCIDMNEQFQMSGKQKLDRWLKTNKDKLSFLNKKIDNNLSLDLHNKSILAGLHSCGELSVEIIKYFSQKKKGGLINFGCCYHQLGDVYNLSKHSKNNPLTLSNNALHLATRSYAYTCEKDVVERKKVKFFRYGLHHLCAEKFNEGFITLGNGHASDYNGEFSAYVKKFYPPAQELTDMEIEDFYWSDRIQSKVAENFYLDFIRALFGRVIEVYLILDRVIYLNESGVEAKLYQVFDRKLSPRNLGLIKV